MYRGKEIHRHLIEKIVKTCKLKLILLHAVIRITNTFPCVSKQRYYILTLIQSIHKQCIYSIYEYIQYTIIFSSE